MSKRKYTKRSDYWKKFNSNEHPSRPTEEQFEPELLGEPFYTSDASYSDVSKARTSQTGSTFTGARNNRISQKITYY